MEPSYAYFAGGCFWCITPVFRGLDGVIGVVSGYSGGDEPDPAYEDVKHQKTGHRETIRVQYDPDRVTYPALLSVFLSSVDPYDGEGQFIDRGHSYTLAVYYTREAERLAAESALESLRSAGNKTVYIVVEPFKSFYRAEEYHQDWDLAHPGEFLEELDSSGRTGYFKKA